MSPLCFQCLDQKDSKSASSVLAIIAKCGENLKLPGGGQGLSGVIGQGLVKKISIQVIHAGRQCASAVEANVFSC